MTNDYGTLNIIEKFQCAHSPSTNPREFVCTDDLLKFYNEWDHLISSAIELMKKVNQPLHDFLSKNQKSQLQNILEFKDQMPSILNNYFEEK
jgi:hypothetical protein